jgi:choline dehydrogenase-like flavoprotein
MPNPTARHKAETKTQVSSSSPSQDLYYVIGSGPAGVACAKALLDAGRRVRMLDAGLTLEPERAALVERLKAKPPEAWTPAELAAYQAGMSPDVGGVPLKLVYGSDFAYREADAHLGTQYEDVGLRPSFAKGGLSNVWGAAMMPFLDSDMAEWPFRLSTLAPHYKAVLQFTGLAACRDQLEQLFPLYSGEFSDLHPSQQAHWFLGKLERNREALAQAGIRFGRSRLGVRGNLPSSDGGCVYCRLCMYGCPYGYIYTSADTVAQLQRNPRFSYQSGVIVDQVRESPREAEVLGYDRTSRQPLTWRGSRVFLAAGTIATTRILLRSLGAYDQTVWLKDSQYFLVPLALFRKARGATRESLHALSQLFIEIADPARQDTTAHVQIYSNNDLISQAVAGAFGPMQRPLGFLVRDLQERLLVAQGYVHSRHSSRIAVRLSRDQRTGKERLELSAELNPSARRNVRKLVVRLCRQAWHLGAMPLPVMLKIAEPGRSFHSGGSFPMSQTPRGFQTDLLGRLPGLRRIHVADATVFPSIPATTITFSAMANAHRIGWEAAREELGS